MKKIQSSLYLVTLILVFLNVVVSQENEQTQIDTKNICEGETDLASLNTLPVAYEDSITDPCIDYPPLFVSLIRENQVVGLLNKEKKEFLLKEGDILDIFVHVINRAKKNTSQVAANAKNLKLEFTFNEINKGKYRLLVEFKGENTNKVSSYIDLEIENLDLGLIYSEIKLNDQNFQVYQSAETSILDTSFLFKELPPGKQNSFTFNFQAKVTKVKNQPNQVSSVPLVLDTPFTLQQRSNQILTFNTIWQIINDEYYDSNFSGVNWQSIKAEFEPRVSKFLTNDEFADTIQEMLNRLNRSHTVYIRDSKTKIIDDESKIGSLGFDIKENKGKLIITRVNEKSPAQEAGIKMGWRLEKIDDIDVYNELAKHSKLYKSKGFLVDLFSSIQYANPNTDVKLELIDEKGNKVKKDLKRHLTTAQVSDIGGTDSIAEFTSQRLDNGVIYVWFNNFTYANAEKLCETIGKNPNASGMIIDLRGNVGGQFILGSYLSGLFLPKITTYGIIYDRTEFWAVFTPKTNQPFLNPLMVLTDNSTLSTAELFTAALKDENRVKVIGEKTAGEVLLSEIKPLPIGKLLMPIANIKNSKQIELEKNGVMPDILAPLDFNLLREGKDSQLEKSITTINEIINKKVNVTKTNITSNVLRKSVSIADSNQENSINNKTKTVIDLKSSITLANYAKAIGNEHVWNKVQTLFRDGTSEFIDVTGKTTTRKILSNSKYPNKIMTMIEADDNTFLQEFWDGSNRWKITQSNLEENTMLINYRVNPVEKIRQSCQSLSYLGKDESTMITNLSCKLGEKTEIIYFFDAKGLLIKEELDEIKHFYKDYRWVKGVRVPFYEESQTNNGTTKIKYNSIKVNEKIYESVFIPRSCLGKQILTY